MEKTTNEEEEEEEEDWAVLQAMLSGCGYSSSNHSSPLATLARAEQACVFRSRHSHQAESCRRKRSGGLPPSQPWNPADNLSGWPSGQARRTIGARNASPNGLTRSYPEHPSKEIWSKQAFDIL